MSGFSADWLTLREPHDSRARNPAVLDAVVAHLEPRSRVRVVDLASGTGSTLRALSGRLPSRQNWTLIDHDSGLLARAMASPLAEHVAAAAVQLDLNLALEAALDRDVDLVAMSALLDLVSATWLDRLAITLAARATPLYAALSYDGRIAFVPADLFDAAIVAAVNMHQLGDKGFGPALGPAAAAFAVARFEKLGYSVKQGASDWVIGQQDKDMQTELLAGWANAARETSAITPAETTAWLARRRQAIAAGQSSLRVGHVDFFAIPSTTRCADRSQSNSTSSSIL
jgi:hypothetical protein